MVELQIEIVEARSRWADLVSQVLHGGVRVVLLKDGRIVGALVGRADWEYLQRHRPQTATGPRN